MLSETVNRTYNPATPRPGASFCVDADDQCNTQMLPRKPSALLLQREVPSTTCRLKPRNFIER
eukprot:IDg19475t1